MMTDNEYMPLDASQPSQNDQEEKQGGKKRFAIYLFFYFFNQSGGMNISILWRRERDGSFESRQSGGE